MSDKEYAIVYFDGVCGLCNKFVNFLFRKDAKKNRLRFATLQGETAKQLHLTETEKMQSIVFEEDGILYRKSTAAIKILLVIGGGWKLMYLCYVFPRFLRDFVYDVVAANRYKWWGKMDACRLPTMEEVAKFLP